jgi:hypothetical protein
VGDWPARGGTAGAKTPRFREQGDPAALFTLPSRGGRGASRGIDEGGPSVGVMGDLAAILIAATAFAVVVVSLWAMGKVT